MEYAAKQEFRGGSYERRVNDFIKGLKLQRSDVISISEDKGACILWYWIH